MRLRRHLTVALRRGHGGRPVVPASAQEPTDGPSSAEVERDLGSAEERLADLEAQASAAVEEVNEAQVELDQVEAELAETTAAAETVTAQMATLRESTDAVARALYKGGGTNLQFGSLLTAEGPSEAGARYSTVQRVLRGHRGDVEELQAARTQLATLESAIADQRDDAEARTAELAERRDALDATLTDQADEIAALEAELADARQREEAARRAEEERQRREAQAREAAERRAAERAAAEREAAAEPAAAEPAAAEPASPAPSSSSSSSSGGGSGEAASAPAPSTRQSAQVAVDTALAQVGKPYQWGGGGPNSFDCSGLTSFGWRAAGVSLPHSSRAQMSATSRVSRGDLQPGDLVFFGSPVHHVAMFIGGGQVVEASRSGVPVQVSSRALGRSDIAGYGRP